MARQGAGTPGQSAADRKVPGQTGGFRTEMEIWLVGMAWQTAAPVRAEVQALPERKRGRLAMELRSLQPPWHSCRITII